MCTDESLDAEWVDEDDVDVSGLSLPPTNHAQSGLPVVAETLELPWE